MSFFKQFLSSASTSKAKANASRRKSEVVTPALSLNGELLGDVPIHETRRYSVPEEVIRNQRIRMLDTILENENLSATASKMNLSPTQRNSPKEKRSFTFFRSRTLSSSSNESSGGNGGTSTSPRLSPRSLLDKVRKRSEKDVKSQASIENNLSPTQHALQLQLQQHLQQQLLQQQQREQQQQQQQQQQDKQKLKYTGPQYNNGVSSRKHLSHSISEENDEAVNNELNNSDDFFYSESTANVFLSTASMKQKNNQMQSQDRSVYFKMSSNSSHTPSNISTNSMHANVGRENSGSSNSSIPHFQHQQSSITRQSSASPHNLFYDVENGFTSIENNQIFSYFMKHKFCYDIMPKSAKIVIFDTQLLVKKAFFALIYNGVRAAPLWDSKNQKFVGMLTITDFILILQKYYRQPNTKIEELEEHKIETWREVLKEYRRPFVSLKPEDTLYDAVKILTKNRVHRLPIIDPITGNVVCIVTHKRILRYLYLFIYDMPHPQFLQQSLEELKVGSFDNVRTIKKNTPISEALNMFVSTRVSALPVVDEDNKLVNIYSKFDVIDLAAEKTYTNLDISVIEALEYRRNRFDGVASCYKSESLGAIMERIVNKEVHRLVIVDNENRVQGIISLSDILTFIILKQSEDATQESKTTTLTSAFGLTRLSSNIDPMPSPSHQHPHSTNSTSSLGAAARASSTSPSPMAISNSNLASSNQRTSSAVDQAIFEDDPMET